MEKYKEDPIQENFRKKLEEAGVELAKENKNRLLTPEEIEDRKRQALKEKK
jgi:hypothetical protein